ncbi:hypothetical protein FM076_07655 [Streptomyces albus subsp. chlorinus]|uniref:hypothetical protein n=1 Tax=Streptomyces albus TaxID=1888 RepID=UPI00156DBB7B|nr:hypothetical protein [Streptomyces albus]NSC21088.1 hypothetical protein [Streptomyces albus subsp. chlorinus]
MSRAVAHAGLSNLEVIVWVRKVWSVVWNMLAAYGQLWLVPYVDRTEWQGGAGRDERRRAPH